MSASTQTTTQPVAKKRVHRPRRVFTLMQQDTIRRAFTTVLAEQAAEAKANPKPRRRGKEPEVVPQTGAAAGMLASFQARCRDAAHNRAQVGRDWGREAYAPIRTKRAVHVPLSGMPHRHATVTAEDHWKLTEVLGLQGTRWFLDPATGAVRAYKRSGMRDAGSSFDVAALIYGLKDGDSYELAAPFDLRPWSTSVHRKAH